MTAKIPAPKHDDHGYSTLEVSPHQGSDLPEAITHYDLPEAVQHDSAPEPILAGYSVGSEKQVTGLAEDPIYHAENQGDHPLRRPLLQRKKFWIALVVALLIVIGVAVGAGVGATRNKGDDSSSSSSGSTSSTSRRGVASTSKLAAANYTDESGVVHSQVYYQDVSLQIWMADWNEKNNSWTLDEVSATDNTSDITPRNGTPIAAYNFWYSVERSDFRCLYMDNSNNVNYLYALNMSASAGWDVMDQLEGMTSSNANSSLVEYMAQCNATEICNSADVALFESPNGDMTLAYPFGNGETSGSATAAKLRVSGVDPDPGTAMAVAPVPKITKRNDAYPKVALYLSADGILNELYGGRNIDWINANLSNLNYGVDTGAQIAAMTQYRQDNDGEWDFNTQVFMSKTGGGVRMAYMNGSDWFLENEVAAMKDVLPLSPIAANQIGRVYALEEGPKVVEWKRIDGSTPTFERVGVVDTTGS